METNAKVLGGRLAQSVSVLATIWVWGLWAVVGFACLYCTLNPLKAEWEGVGFVAVLAVASEVINRWVRWMFRPA